MKIFILFVSLVFGIFAIAVYAKGLKHRIKEITDRSDKKKLKSNKQDDLNTSLLYRFIRYIHFLFCNHHQSHMNSESPQDVGVHGIALDSSFRQEI